MVEVKFKHKESRMLIDRIKDDKKIFIATTPDLAAGLDDLIDRMEAVAGFFFANKGRLPKNVSLFAGAEGWGLMGEDAPQAEELSEAVRDLAERSSALGSAHNIPEMDKHIAMTLAARLADVPLCAIPMSKKSIADAGLSDMFAN